MYKIIGGDHKEYGPATAEEMRQWIAEGRLNGQSLTQSEGSQEWKPLGRFAEFADALQAQPRQALSAKPLAPGLSAEAWKVQMLASHPQLRIGRCLLLSWRLVLSNPGLLFGATCLVWLLSLLQFTLPTAVIYLFIKGPLYGGLCLIFLNRIRGQPASSGDLFKGFGSDFVQLMLAGFLTSLLSGIGICCLIVPGLYLYVAWTFSVPLVADRRLEFWSAMELSRIMVSRVWFEVFGLLVLVFLPVILAYILVEIKVGSMTVPLMQDIMTGGQPDFGRILEAAREIAKVSLPLTLLLKLVLLLNWPFAVGALMYAYEDLFGTRAAPTA